MIMHESEPDPQERDEDEEEHDSGFDVPDEDEPQVPEYYPPTVASYFDAAGIRNPPGT